MCFRRKNYAHKHSSRRNKSAERNKKIVEILNSDVIIFPKTILKCDEVYEESKMLFSLIFTHSLQNHAEDSNICLTVTQEMKKILGAMSDEEIQLNCFCTRGKVGVIKSEARYLINHGKINKCIRETGKGAV